MPETPGCFASLETRASLRGVGRPFLSPTRPNLHLRAVLGLRPRRCSRVWCPQAFAGFGLRTPNTFALALTDAPCFFVTSASAFFSRSALGTDVAVSAGAPVPSEFRACGAPVPTLRRSPPLRGRAVMTFFFGWRPERHLGRNGWRSKPPSYGHGGM